MHGSAFRVQKGYGGFRGFGFGGIGGLGGVGFIGLRAKLWGPYCSCFEAPRSQNDLMLQQSKRCDPHLLHILSLNTRLPT